VQSGYVDFVAEHVAGIGGERLGAFLCRSKCLREHQPSRVAVHNLSGFVNQSRRHRASSIKPDIARPGLWRYKERRKLNIGIPGIGLDTSGSIQHEECTELEVLAHVDRCYRRAVKIGDLELDCRCYIRWLQIVWRRNAYG